MRTDERSPDPGLFLAAFVIGVGASVGFVITATVILAVMFWWV
jgi:hypothetical protein